MVLDDDDDKDYIDYESPEELPVYEDEEEQKFEDLEDQDSTTENSQSEIDSDQSDSEFNPQSDPICQADNIDESSMEVSYPIKIYRGCL